MICGGGISCANRWWWGEGGDRIGVMKVWWVQNLLRQVGQRCDWDLEPCHKVDGVVNFPIPLNLVGLEIFKN